MKTLADTLRSRCFADILPNELLHGPAYLFNLGENSDFSNIDPTDTAAMNKRTNALLKTHRATIGIGKYGEQRELYQHALYQDQRNIHLGIDLTVPADTPVFSPMPAEVHSLQNNNQPGDYGPTVILLHKLDNTTFYTLYGHLASGCLHSLQPKQTLSQGEKFAAVGTSLENGGWPAHLHFQIVTDLQAFSGDYPGVCHVDEKKKWLKRCPDPNLILKLNALA